ncbi:hypothetical protein KC352_g39617 [Hortaea werneckii]|nr:hypothetical protein KC352_g39617 [Hortaea werneckii]
MGEEFTKGTGGGWMIKEVQVRPPLRKEVEDEEVQGKLWRYSEEMVEEGERRGKEGRAKIQREEKESKEEAEAVREMEDYKTKVGKKEGKKMEGSRRGKKGSA